MRSVVVVGHVTKDLIRIPGRADHTMTGGSAFYTGVALARLGLSVRVVTKLASADRALVRPLEEAGVEVTVLPSPRTTVFENSYSGEGLSKRHQRVPSVASAFVVEDLAGLEADAIHLGPLTADEMEEGLYAAAREVAPQVSFDAQGVLRAIVDQGVVPAAPHSLARMLAHVDVLKVDDLEGALLCGESDPELAARALGAMGPREVLVTFADRGSLLFTDGVATRIPACTPPEIVDATGCGDTFIAGYVASRLHGRAAPEAARLAAAAASAKLERYGPYEGSWDHLTSFVA